VLWSIVTSAVPLGFLLAGMRKEKNYDNKRDSYEEFGFLTYLPKIMAIEKTVFVFNIKDPIHEWFLKENF
jgi:hypothetical protein